MRKVMSIAILHLKTLFRTPSAIVMMFIMPIMFSIIFGGIGSEGSSQDKPHVLVVTEENESNGRIVDLLSSNDQYTWLKADEKQARSSVENQEAIAAVLIAESIVESLESEKPFFQIVVQRKRPGISSTKQLYRGCWKDSYPNI
ncbi:hypothetical protein [Mesobacillus selenatarsenatis]|uniref:Uncharacterized protein n=1 Tax=Mesobacillus selenatarsenatis (strain DSM 18680 / JCM 14380 / FERM P-15431 / SF-1) TaxID=1321606 RepID=A0A0A8X4R8_MESS1|nr:hypothetical protein [Mesobacillus selenatarsenatis]GAM14950.1 hypothetical protein SAMD00020551_3106 [Mesobacillus selenatarsenatis SF-1]